MKRLALTTALTATFAAGSALALTEAERATIERFLPDANLEMMTEAQNDALLAFASSGESFSERQAKMEAYVQSEGMVTASLTDAQRERILAVEPTLNIDALTDAEQQQAVAIVGSGDGVSEQANQLRALGTSDMPQGSAPLTAAEMQTINRINPEFDVDTLTSDEVAQLRAALASGDRSEISTLIDSLQAG